MEIEAKFSLPDLQTFHRLRAASHLGGFALSPGQVRQVHDVYLDTQDRRIMAAGYVCRRRQQDGEVLITLKQLKAAEGAIHRREELEMALPGERPPVDWPVGPIRNRVLAWVGEAALIPLFSLEQVRIVRQVHQEARLVAELSLDGVHLAAGERRLSFFELESEMADEGTEEDLAAIVNCLRDEWQLQPENRSKFERALAFVEAARLEADRPEQPSRPVPQTFPQTLSLRELFERYGVDQVHARTVADHALALFDHLFPLHGLSPQRRPLLEVAALVHNVGLVTDPGRRHVAGRNILLAHPLAGLDGQERLMVALTTFLHRKRITPKKLNKLDNTAFAELPGSLQKETLALAALVRMADGLDYSQTSSSQLGEVRHSEHAIEIEVVGPHATTDAERAQEKSDLWHLLFESKVRFRTPYRGDIRNGLPEDETEEEITVHETASANTVQDVQPEPEVVPQVTEKPPKEPGLEPDDSMAEAARKTMNLHFLRMLYHEPGTRLGEDIEELHDMRVATRRMRAAFDVFGDYLDQEQLAPILKGLRRTGRTLGAVRDLDVFWEKTEHYLKSLPPDQPVDLEPLRKVWEAERQAARERMLAYLDSRRYARFKERFYEFLQTPGAGALPVVSPQGEPVPHRLCHVVPVAVYQRRAAVWAYDEWVTRPDVPLERLHQLRIASKGLRYTLEYFREVLGPEAEALVDEVKKLQDHLGDLHDAVVASSLLRDFLTWGTWGHQRAKEKKASPPAAGIVAPGVATYLAARQTELKNLLNDFPQVWAHFSSPELSRSLASALAPLYEKGQAFSYPEKSTENVPSTAGDTSSAAGAPDEASPDTELIQPQPLDSEQDFQPEGGKSMAAQPTFIVLLGPPASGKGTQAAQLREHLNLPHIASGDLFRENLKNETELGLKAKAYMDRGELVPDDVTIAMVMDRLSQPDCADGAILDGFPRTIAQAKALDEALAAQGCQISVVPYIKVPEEILVERVSGRRLCRICGESYHVIFNPPKQPGICDKDGGELYQRDDDKPETVRKRLKVYWDQTSPLIDYYRNKRLLVEIDGNQPIETVQADLRAAVARAIQDEP